MSSFKHFRNNGQRYNIYETYIEELEPKSYYVPIRNILTFIAISVSLAVMTLITFDIYTSESSNSPKILLINQMQQNQVKDEITKLKLSRAISNSIIQRIDSDTSLKEINQLQIERIIHNVMEKVKNSPNQITYTQK